MLARRISQRCTRQLRHAPSLLDVDFPRRPQLLELLTHLATKRRSAVYMMPKFDFLEMLQCIPKFKITDLELGYALQHLEEIEFRHHVYCAAPLGREVCEEFEKLWPPGKINVKQGWGMTELTCAALGYPPGEHS